MREGRTARRGRAGETDLVVVGSVNVDLVVRVARLPGPGETVGGGTFERHGGGKGANTAVAAAHAGAMVRLLAAVGKDEDGSRQLRELAADGVDVSGVARVDAAATGRALIVVAESGENQIAVASGANAVLDGSRVREGLARVKPAGDAICLLGFEVGDEAVEVATDWALAHRVRVVLNPAPPRPIPPAVLAARPILTPNEGEALALAGGSDIEAAGRSLAERSGAPVVVTLGADGVLVATSAASAYRVPALHVAVLDTTGAGDAFNGALAARLAHADSLEVAVRWAVAAASLKVTRRGARASPRADEVERELARR